MNINVIVNTISQEVFHAEASPVDFNRTFMIVLPHSFINSRMLSDFIKRLWNCSYQVVDWNLFKKEDDNLIIYFKIQQ